MWCQDLLPWLFTNAVSQMWSSHIDMVLDGLLNTSLINPFQYFSRLWIQLLLIWSWLIIFLLITFSYAVKHQLLLNTVNTHRCAWVGICVNMILHYSISSQIFKYTFIYTCTNISVCQFIQRYDFFMNKTTYCSAEWMQLADFNFCFIYPGSLCWSSMVYFKSPFYLITPILDDFPVQPVFYKWLLSSSAWAIDG